MIRLAWFVPALLLTLQVALLAISASLHSPTINEPGHLVAGIYNWQFARFDLYNVNPPLVRMAAAAPVVASGIHLNWRAYYGERSDDAAYALGEGLVSSHRQNSLAVFRLARWSCIPFSILGGWFCYVWANQLYGRTAGILSITLWTFCPNLLAHGQLITSDVAAAALGVCASYAFWKWLKLPTWRQAILAGFSLGTAVLAKTTILIFYPLWPIVWLVFRWPDRRALDARPMRREAGMLTITLAIGFWFINGGYLFEGTGTLLGDYRFASEALGAQNGEATSPQGGGNRFRDSWLGSLPVPLPASFVLGIDSQRRDFEYPLQPSYLNGEFRQCGWWYYYLYALVVKLPLGTWLLVLLAASIGLCTKVNALWRDEFVLLCPAVAVLMFVSSQTGFSAHMRYVLPAFPFVYVWIGRLGAAFDGRHRVLATATAGALAWSVASSLWVYPHSLSYFNELAGGPTGGPAHLIYSNVDWGQDLLFLKKWLDLHPEARPMSLAYFGYCNPRDLGVDCQTLDTTADKDSAGSTKSDIAPGWYAISVNFVRGFPWFIYQADGSKVYLRQYELAAFQKLKPVAMAGYSIYIYHVE